MSKPIRQEWDTEFSTFWWIIHLNRSHALNSPSVERITGYSKYRNQSEAQDKEYVLKRKIAMLYKRGYFDRMRYVEFHYRQTEVIDRNRDPLILFCFPHYYDIPPAHHDTIYKKFGSWLQLFYDRINKRAPIDDIVPAVRKGTNKDDFIDPSKYNFADVAQLYAHAARLTRHGHAPGAVESFIKEYKSRRQW
jgi:hypothetical protein